MSEVNWGLLGNGFNAMESLGAFQQGQDRRMALNQVHAQQQKAAQVAQLTQRAVGGDAGARQQLAGLDCERFAALDKDSHAQWKQDAEQLGQFALLADTPEKWDAYARQYVQMGHPEAARYIGKFSPEARAAIIAQAGQAKELLAQQEAKWTSIPEGGTLVNTRDPAAVAAYQSGSAAPSPPAAAGQPGMVSSPEQYASLPPGTPYIAPDGSHRVKGGAPSQGGATFP